MNAVQLKGNAMTVIQCILANAKSGRTVEIGGKDHVFTENAKGDLVCEVQEAGHVKVFLGIPEGYRRYGGKGEQTSAAPYSVEMTPDLPPDEELSKLSDEELERLAKARYGVDLDRRENEASMVEKIMVLEASRTEPHEPEKAAAKAETAAKPRKPKKSKTRKKSTRK